MKTTLKITFSFLFALTAFTACKKDETDTQILATGIGFVHASPGTGALDIVVDNQRVSSFTFNEDKGYYAAYPGARLLGVVKKDSTKYLKSGYANLLGGKNYSVFVIDTLKSIDLLVVNDDLSVPEADKAKIRFINLIPRSSAVDIEIEGQSSALFTGKAFKENTDFTSIAPNDSYTFNIKEAGNVTATLPAVKIEKGKIYTLWAKGLKTATDSTKVALAVMNNN